MGPQDFSDNAETLHLASTDLVVTQFRAFAKHYRTWSNS